VDREWRISAEESTTMKTFEIHKMLVASTAHLPQEAATQLDEAVRFQAIGPERIHELLSWAPSLWRDTGWVWYVGATDATWLDEAPPELRKLFAVARGQDCCWLMLDCDAEEIEGLEVFEW
jgi:hypothetical protein